MVTENVDIKVNVYEGALKGLLKNLGATSKALKSISGPAARTSRSFIDIQKSVQGYTDTLKMANKTSVKDLFNSKRVDLFNKRLNSLYVSAKKAAKPVRVLTKDVKEYTTVVQQANKTALSGMFKQSISGAQKLQKQIEKNTNALLSMLFLGIWLQQVMTKAMRSIFEGYKKAIPEGHKFNRMTNQLSANWEYFKFQLANALANSPLFQKFVMFLVNILKKLQNLSPEAKVFLGVMVGVTAVLGGIFFLLGQIGLGMQGLIMLSNLFQKSVNNFSWGKMLAITAVIGAIATVIAALGILKSSITKTKEESELFDEKWTKLGDLFMDTISKALAPLGIEFDTVGEMMFWVSGIAQILFSYFTQGLNTIISITDFLMTTFYMGWKAIVALFKDVARAAIAAWNAIRGKDYDKGAFFSLDNLTESMKSARDDLKDIGADWLESTKDISDNTLTFEEIRKEIEKYREETDKASKSTSQLAKDSQVLTDMGIGAGADNSFDMNSFVGKVNTPKNKENNQVNNTVYIDREWIDNEGSDEDVSEIINRIQKNTKTDLGFNI